MDRPGIIEQLTEIIEDVFDEDDFTYADSISATDIEEWDSLSNIRFIVAVEQEFSIRFTNSEIEGLAIVGQLVSLVQSKAG